MLCYTSKLSSVLRSATLRLRRTALCFAAHLCSDLLLGLRKAALCFDAHLCCILALEGLEELLYAVLYICAVIYARISSWA